MKVAGLALVMFCQSSSVRAGEVLITLACTTGTDVESVQDLEKVMDRPADDLQLKENEVINGVVISSNKRFVALDVFNSVTTSTSRIIVVSKKDKTIRSHDVKLTDGRRQWCSELGAVGDTGEWIMANIGTIYDTRVKYVWSVVRLEDFSIVETGLERMLEKWTAAGKSEAGAGSEGTGVD